MAVIHISEAEAARDLPGLLAKVRSGEEVRITSGAESVTLVQVSKSDPRSKTLTEAIRLADERQLEVTLDDQFSDDLEAIITNHEYARPDPWAE